MPAMQQAASFEPSGENVACQKGKLDLLLWRTAFSVGGSVFMSHNRTVLSSPAVTILEPSRLKATLLTRLVWHLRAGRSTCPLTLSSTKRTPFSSVTARVFPSGERAAPGL